MAYFLGGLFLYGIVLIPVALILFFATRKYWRFRKSYSLLSKEERGEHTRRENMKFSSDFGRILVMGVLGIGIFGSELHFAELPIYERGFFLLIGIAFLYIAYAGTKPKEK